MNRLSASFISFLMAITAMAQGWPSQYDGIMLQAFYWDSYEDTNWTVLERQADDLASTFSLVWLPQSGNCGGRSMGYDDLYWFNNYNSSFGNEQQLRSLISTFRSKGIKTIADVVINHRRNVSNWVDFPKETYKGVTYEMTSTDICYNDDGGNTRNWATKNGYQLSANADTGEDWGGMRDLDHKSQNVQRCVKAYLGFLRNDLGYDGFRYDMVKGYSASFTGQYNVSSQPEFSVGECWDGTNTIKNWIEGTKVNDIIQSAAFDFQFKYVVRNATDRQDWSYLNKQNDGNWPLVSSNFEQGKYRRYAVTFVENHDTQVRLDGSSNGPLKKDTLAANAYMLAMPGTPCVFLKHWQDYSVQIKAMVAARKQAGINSESAYGPFRSNTNYYASIIKTNDENRLLVVVGKVAMLEEQGSIDASQWAKVLEGYHYAYYFPTSMNTAYADLPSGRYAGPQKVRLTAVTANGQAQLVYTTDGSAPTAQSKKAASGTEVTIPTGTTTLKVAILADGQVTGLVSRTYIISGQVTTEVMIPSFCTVSEDETCAFFEAPASWTSTIMCWAWDTRNYTGGSWPGEPCEKLGDAPDGNAVWKWKYSGTLTTKPEKIIFSNNGSPQTADLKFQNGGYYTKDGLFGVVAAGVNPVVADEHNAERHFFDLQGRRVSSQPKPGIYVVNGCKVVIR